jgi:hypothetical protein
MEQWGVSHYSLAIYIKKYINAKEELWKFKYFTMQKHNLQKQRNQNPSRYHNSRTNLKVSTQAKISSFKTPRIKIDILLSRGRNPLSYYTP